MAQRLLKVQKRKVAPAKAATPQPNKIVLVGTYAGNQLKEWPGKVIGCCDYSARPESAPYLVNHGMRDMRFGGNARHTWKSTRGEGP